MWRVATGGAEPFSEADEIALRTSKSVFSKNTALWLCWCTATILAWRSTGMFAVLFHWERLSGSLEIVSICNTRSVAAGSPIEFM